MTDTFKVNFSEEEAGSEAFEFKPIPPGSYVANIYEIKLAECGPESKNPGKPFWKVQLRVAEGEHERRVLFTNVMLFDGSLYSLAQLLKATGNEAALKSGKIPAPETLIGKKVGVVVRRVRDKYQEEQVGDGEPIFKNEVSGFKTPDAVRGKTGSKAGSGSGSLLP